MTLALPALLLLACNGTGSDTGAQAGAFTIDVSMSEIVPTVATVSFDLPQATTATVAFGRDGSFDQEHGLDLSDDAHLVLGMKAGSTYSLRVEAETPDGRLISEEVSVETGNLPNDLPELFIEEPAGEDQHSGGFIVTSFITPPTAIIFDRDGDIVWWYRPEETQQLGRVRLGPDGDRVWMGDVNLTAEPDGELISVGLDGSDEQRITMDWRHHDFLVHEDGTAAVIAYDPREVDDVHYLGDRIVEIAPDGTETEVYNVYDHHVAGTGQSGVGPGGDSNWPHANALDYVPEEDMYLISFMALEGIAAVDRATGEELWMLGGEDSTLTTPESPREFKGGQHGMQWLDGSMVLFANGTDGDSRGVEYDLDLANRRAVETWRYAPGLTTPTMGDVNRFDNGNTLVTFSYNGEMHEVTPEGELLWVISASLGGAMAYTTWHETLPPWN